MSSSSESSQSGTVVSNWSHFIMQCYASRQPPACGTFDVDKLEQLALEKLKESRGAIMYVVGNAGTGATYANNRRAFDKWVIVPRMLRNVTVRNLGVSLFGVNYPSPVFVAPLGVQGTLHPEGDIATATAAREVGVPYIMSSASTSSIEAVAEACGSSPRWFQLYWPDSKDVLTSLLNRAKANGFSALVVTLDSPMIGWRPSDLETAYLPFAHGIGAQIALTDPVMMGRFGRDPLPYDERPSFPYLPERVDALIREGDAETCLRAQVGAAFAAEAASGKFKAWTDLAILKERWDGPLILKGIRSVEDAELAIDHGVDGIVVSNYGGRQIDGAVSSLRALQMIMQSPKVRAAQDEGRFTVLFDSGIRTGSDILKAIAFGAQAVLYGRPVLYSLAVGGREGVASRLRAVLADFDATLALSGYSSLEEIRGKTDSVLTNE